MSYWLEKLDRVPPNVCRLLAREPRKAKQARTTETISKLSGFSKQKIRSMSRLRSWKTVTLGDMEIFKEACGLVCGRECLQVAYIKRTFNKSKTSTPLYHIRRLMKARPDKRLEKYMAELMRPKDA